MIFKITQPQIKVDQCLKIHPKYIREWLYGSKKKMEESLISIRTKEM